MSGPRNKSGILLFDRGLIGKCLFALRYVRGHSHYQSEQAVLDAHLYSKDCLFFFSRFYSSKIVPSHPRPIFPRQWNKQMCAQLFSHARRGVITYRSETDNINCERDLTIIVPSFAKQIFSGAPIRNYEGRRPSFLKELSSRKTQWYS
jgi:hypothetical protein